MQLHPFFPIALLFTLATAYPKIQGDDLDEQHGPKAKQHPLLQARASPTPGVSHAGPSTPRPDGVHSDAPTPVRPAPGTRTPNPSPAPSPNAPSRIPLGPTVDATEIEDLEDVPRLSGGTSAPQHDEGSAAASRPHRPTTPVFMLHCKTNPTIGNRCNAECRCDARGEIGCVERHNHRNGENVCFKLCRCEAGDAKHEINVVTNARNPREAAMVDALLDTRT